MLEKEREERYLQESLGMVTHLVDAEGVSYGLIPADQYHSVLGHFLLDKFPQHEYVVMIDFRSEKASLRGRGNVHLGEMAEKVGGGGHKKAAGFQLSDSAAKLFINCKDCIHANPENITEEA